MILLNTILDYTDRCQGQTTMYQFVMSWKMRGPLNSLILPSYVRKVRDSFMEFISTFEIHDDDLYRWHPDNFDFTHYSKRPKVFEQQKFVFIHSSF